MRKLFLLVTLLFTINAKADLLDETRSNNVNKPSVHLDCQLEDKSSAIFASYSKVVISTEFGNDGPSVYALDYEGNEVEGLALSDFSEHPTKNMRIFVLTDYDQNLIANLVVIYEKTAKGIGAFAVLTTNGKSSPGVVSNQEMKCKVPAKLAIND